MLYQKMMERERKAKERKATTTAYLIATFILVLLAGVCQFAGNTALAVVVLIAAVLMAPFYMVMMALH